MGMVHVNGYRPLPDHTTWCFVPAHKCRRKSRAPGWVFLSLVLAIFIPFQGMAAETPETDLKSVERALKQSEARSRSLALDAKRITKERAKIRKTLISAARDTQIRQRAIDRLKNHVARLRAQERAKTQSLNARRKSLTELIAALQRIARHPPEAVMAYSATPQDTLRSALLLRSAIPEVESRARELKETLSALTRLRTLAGKREANLASKVTALKHKRRELYQLLKKKRALEKKALSKHTRSKNDVLQLAAKAKSLRDLLEKLKQHKKRLRTARLLPPPSRHQRRTKRKLPKHSETRPFVVARARGNFAPPVLGTITARYGAKVNFGPKNKGLRISTTPQAQVIAPFDGLVVFAGPFRGYGRLLIIDHGGGYHTLLSGLERIDTDVNQRLLTGEPIGTMGQPSKGRPELYLELRRNGQPINPLPWLAAPPTDKVSG
jgi:septal ring factor EnvC (AmiA/AmiB activator)